MRSAVLLVLAVAPAFAAELVRRDLSLALEALPTAFDYDISGPAGSSSGSDHFDRALGLRLGGRWSLAEPGATGAWVVGADVRFADATYGDDGTYRTLGIAVSAGYGWQFSRRWQASLEPLFEYGRARLAFAASSATGAIAADGSHLLWGARAGVAYAIARRWRVEVDGGWADISSRTSGGGRTFDLDQSGLLIGVGLVYQVSSAPARLE